MIYLLKKQIKYIGLWLYLAFGYSITDGIQGNCKYDWQNYKECDKYTPSGTWRNQRYYGTIGEGEVRTLLDEMPISN